MRLLIAVVLALFWAGQAVAQSETRQITVTGHGKISARPDMAKINVGVEVTARKAGDALHENSKLILELMDVLDKAGVAKRDIRTSQLNLQPRWEQRNNSGAAPSVIGYTAQNILQIRIRKVGVLGDVLDKVTRSGANRINQVSFSVADPAPLLKEARLRAVANARQKADLFAIAAGVSLGKVLEITENTIGGGAFPRATARMEAAAAVPIAEGEVSYSAQVQITYTLN